MQGWQAAAIRQLRLVHPWASPELLEAILHAVDFDLSAVEFALQEMQMDDGEKEDEEEEGGVAEVAAAPAPAEKAGRRQRGGKSKGQGSEGSDPVPGRQAPAETSASTAEGEF